MKCIVCKRVVGGNEMCQCSATPDDRKKVAEFIDERRHSPFSVEELVLEIIRLRFKPSPPVSKGGLDF